MSARLLASVALAASGLAVVGGAGGGVSASGRSAAKVPAALWGVEVDARSARTLGAKRLASLRKGGINALVADPSRVRGGTLANLRRRATRARLLVLVPRSVRRKGVRTASAAKALCRGASRCVVMASSSSTAPRLSRTAGVDLVAVRVAGAAASARLQHTSARRLLALVRLTPSPAKRPAAWRAAIRAARASAKLDLAVSGPAGAVDAYLALLSEQGGGSGNPPAGPPPSPPSPPSPPPPGPPPPPPGWWPPPPPPVPDGPASVWVSTIGSDSTCARLDPSRPCQTFNRAYRIAQPGDQVEVGGGTYPRQNVDEDSSKTSDVDVVFRPAPGAVVTLGCEADLSDCLAVSGNHVTVKNLRMAVFPPLAGMPRQGGVCICRGSDDVTFYNLDAGYVFIAGDNARVIGGDYGPVVDQVSKIEVNEGGRPPKNILIDGLYTHDHRGHNRHPECWALYAGENVTIRNSRLNNCEVFGMFLAPGDGVATNWLIENNFFSNTGGVPMSTHLKTRSNGTCHNILIRHNTFVGEDVISECPGSNTRWESNIFSRLNGCVSVGSMDYNVVQNGSKCGPHDIQVGALGLVNVAVLDLHLTADSPARGRGNPASATSYDIDGESRPNPAGSPPDAGADERS
jgi:hypothetical protein